MLELIPELVGWTLIALSPTGIGALVGFFLRNAFPAPWGLALWIALAVIGFVLGAILATHKWKNGGTVHFLSRVHASDDIG